MSQLKAQVDKLLTNVSNGNFPRDYNYICEQLLPSLEVKQNTGLLGKYGASHLRIEHSLMGGRGKAKRVEAIVRSTTGYSLENHGLEGFVSEDDYDNVEAPFDAEKDEVEGVTSMILTGKESALASAMTNSAVITQYDTLSGTDQFSDYVNSDPLGVAQDAVGDIKTGSGTVANTLVCPWAILNVLKYHPQILSRLGFDKQRAGLLSQDDIAKAFDVKKIFVPDAVYNSAKEGQTDVLAEIWGKHMIFAYIPDSAKPYQKSLGYYVKKQGAGTRKVYKYPENNPPNSMNILVQDRYQFLLSDVLCAKLVKNAVA